MSKLEELQERVDAVEAINVERMAVNVVDRLLGRACRGSLSHPEPDYEWVWLYNHFHRSFGNERGQLVNSRRQELRERLKAVAKANGLTVVEPGQCASVQSLTSQQGSLTSQQGSLTSQQGSLTSQQGSLTSQQGSLTSQQLGQNLGMAQGQNLQGTVK